MKYKEAMEKLEVILSRIDESEMEVDELAAQVEEATALLKRCRKILLEAEKSVQDSLTVLEAEFNESSD